MTIALSTFEPKKILVCQLRQIGDVVISTAMVELLAARYPGAEIQFLTEAKCAPILENNPHITTVWTVKNGGMLHDLKTYVAIRRQRFDLVIDFQQLPRSRRAALLSGAPVRLTYATKWYKRPGYSHFSTMHKGGYAGKFKAQMLAPLDIDWNMQPPRMYISPSEKSWASGYLRSQGLNNADTLVTVDPTHWSDTRRWPAHHFAELIRSALKTRPELRFYLLHGPGERDQVEEVVRISGRADRCTLPPQTLPNLRETAAVIHRAALQVGNCSAPRHMAVALGIPTLTIIGSNGTSAWTFPDKSRHCFVRNKIPCSKCNENHCPRGTLECLEKLSPETVLERFFSLLPQAGRV